MNYTANYRLPQWVEDDRILMEDFNQAFKNLEDGVTAAKSAADGAATAAEQGQQGVTALTPRVTALEQAVKFVKLGTIQAGGAGTYSLDLSGSNLSGFSNLILDCSISGLYTGACLFINGDLSGKYHIGSDTTSTAGISLGCEGGGNTHTIAYLHPFENKISCSCQRDILDSYGARYETEAMGYSGCSLAGISSLLLKTTGGGVAKIIVYGIKA